LSICPEAPTSSVPPADVSNSTQHRAMASLSYPRLAQRRQGRGSGA
jgi:hypothetical protein